MDEISTLFFKEYVFNMYWCLFSDVISLIAYLRCENLERVHFPPTVREIGAEAFYFCKRLSTVVLSERMTAVGPRAFRGCEALHTVVAFARLVEIVFDFGDSGDVGTAATDPAFRV